MTKQELVNDIEQSLLREVEYYLYGTNWSINATEFTLQKINALANAKIALCTEIPMIEIPTGLRK